MIKRTTLLLLALALILSLGCTAAPVAATHTEGTLTVSFIDVGQADCILVYDGTHAVLVDGGNAADGELVVDYLKSQGISTLDYVVGTHPHEDHIGGLKTVLASMPVGAVIMPDQPADSSVYRHLIRAIADAGVTRIDALAGLSFTPGAFTMDVLAPVKDYDSLNDVSVVVRVVFGENSFLLTGDIEAEAEKDILATGVPLESDVLKAPHHGSNSSSTYVFLRAINPKMVAIMCGMDNDYGHPHEEPLSRFRDVGATVFRTDLMGTVVLTSDGHTITSNVDGIKSPVPHTQAADRAELANYIGNKNSKRFHLPTCDNLPLEKNRVRFDSREEALDAGFTPCGQCAP